jgi:predicted nucleic acid-binding protein
VTALLDASVLIPLLLPHEFAPAAKRWFAGLGEPIATCPITQGALIRAALRTGLSGSDAQELVGALQADARHRFWPDDLPYSEVALDGVYGHRQVTDAYLAGLARRRQARLATFDIPLADLHADVAWLVPR